MCLIIAACLNLDNVIEEAIGAFFGFVFALISAAIIAFIKRRFEINKLKKSLRIELSGIKEDLCNKDFEDKLLFYSTPFWDSIISTGSWLSFSILARKKIIKNFLDPVGQVYAKIKMLDELEKSVSIVNGNVTIEIKSLRKDICSSIDELIFMKTLLNRIKNRFIKLRST